MEEYAEQIHQSVRRIEAYQRHNRVRESQGRKRAEVLNQRVLMWSSGCTLAILLVSIGQVIILKRFFQTAQDKMHVYEKPGVIDF